MTKDKGDDYFDGLEDDDEDTDDDASDYFDSPDVKAEEQRMDEHEREDAIKDAAKAIEGIGGKRRKPKTGGRI